MFILYLKPDCPYCQESQDLILKYNFKHKFNVIKDSEAREKLKLRHKMSTFPQIFYKNNKKLYKIGGNEDLIEKLKHCNKLRLPLLNSIKNNNINLDLLIIKNIYKQKKISKKYINILNKLIK